MLKEASSAGNAHSAIRGFIAAMVALLTKPDVEASVGFTASVWFAKVRDPAGQNCKASNGMRTSKASRCPAAPRPEATPSLLGADFAERYPITNHQQLSPDDSDGRCSPHSLVDKTKNLDNSSSACTSSS